MSPRKILPALFLVAACEVPDNPVRSNESGATQVQVQDGRNCLQNRCFDLDTRYGTVQMVGRNRARIPADINYADGFVTVAEFNRMHNAANQAYAAGIGRR